MASDIRCMVLTLIKVFASLMKLWFSIAEILEMYEAHKKDRTISFILER
jgi:hypothetical protein